jgi:DNA-binding beta-propeller fold protein YncE
VRRIAPLPCFLLFVACAHLVGSPPIPASVGDERDATKGSLLYVSDTATNDVYFYTYPRGKFVGALTGFDYPQGLCADSRGDVFIDDANAHEILEYAHGGQTPIATLLDGTRDPEGCSVDPTTGNLAVTDNGPGSVAIYRNARGKPKHYHEPNQYYHLSQYFFCGYDDAGNLFVDGVNYSSSPTFKFAELPKGGKRLVNLVLDQSIGWPGGVQWDGRYLAVGDANSGIVYQFRISKKHGTLEGTTPLEGSSGVNQFWIAGPRIIGPNANGINVMLWKYPVGGSPIRVIANPRPQPHQPYGATVSGDS